MSLGLSVGLFGAAVALLPGLAGAQGQTPTVTARDYYFQAPDGSRMPASVTIATGGAVSFGYPAGSNQHDVHFTGGPAAPSCAGANGASQAAFDSSGQSATPQGPGWSGTCTFSAPGDYSFECTKHPSTMSGTVHVGSTSPPTTGTTTPTTTTTYPTPPTTPGATPTGTTPTGTGPGPGAGGGGVAASALKLPAVQRGTAAKGAVTIASSSSDFEADLLGNTSQLARSVLVGKTAKHGVGAGKLSFKVTLNKRGRAALKRHRRLALKLVVKVSGPSGAQTSLSRSVTLRS